MEAHRHLCFDCSRTYACGGESCDNVCPACASQREGALASVVRMLDHAHGAS